MVLLFVVLSTSLAAAQVVYFVNDQKIISIGNWLRTYRREIGVYAGGGQRVLFQELAVIER